ncbi:MAG: LytR C-terminal domain-containing protein [Microbacterium sp.]
MPKSPPPKDRFDDLPADRGRIGAHRAENPRMRGGLVLLWSAVATVVLVALGIFGTLIATGRVTLFPTPTPTVTVTPTAEAVLDTSYKVTILNATSQEGLAGTFSDKLVDAGWSADDVTAGEAGSDDFETTTVYYSDAADEGAARGLAEAVGGAEVALSDAYDYLVGDDGESQLVLVIGLDRTTQATPTP